MRIFRLVGGELESNGYLLYDEDEGEVTIIDPGYSPERFQDYLEEEQLVLKNIILTHSHHDHVGGVDYLVEKWRCPVYMHPEDAPYVDFATEALNEDAVIRIGGEGCYVSNLRGHTKGGLGLYFPKEKAIFTGDTVFTTEIGLTNLPGGSPKEMAESCARLDRYLPDDTVIYAGHGEPATMSEMRKMNAEFSDALDFAAKHGYDRNVKVLPGVQEKDRTAENEEVWENKSKYRLLALDLDGTTITDHVHLSKANALALHRAMESGVHIVIATGRSFSSLPEVILFLDWLEYSITSNGGEVRNLKEGTLLKRNCISKDATLKIHEILARDPHMIELFVKGHPYMDQDEYDGIVDGTITSRSRGYVMATRNPIPDIMNFLKHKAGEIESINMFFPDDEDRENMRKTLLEIPDINITSSMSNNLEIGGENTSKGDAVEFLVDYLGITQEEVIACGDSANDASMVERAGLGVAVANAEESLKEVADVVTVSGDDDAIAKIIYDYIFQVK